MAKWPADEENKSRKGKTTGKTCKPFWLDSLTSSVFDHLVGFTGKKKKIPANNKCIYKTSCMDSPAQSSSAFLGLSWIFSLDNQFPA